MRHSLTIALTAVVIGAGSQIPSAAIAEAPAGSRSAYVQAVLADKPTALLQGLTDLTGNTPSGTAISSPATTTLPNGDTARAFNGNGQYLQFADNKAFEIDNTGKLTVEYWMRPDALQFSQEESSGYVYTLGKGNAGSHEYYGRMYSKTNQESRPNRISGYSFNPAGGLGTGSYFQDTVKTGEWIHVALVINAKDKTSQYPMGYTKIYKNGVLRDTDSLKDYNITPKSGTAPFRVGTGYLNSFFQGAVGDIAFYNTELTAAQLTAHNKAMSGAAAVPPKPESTPSPDPAPAPAPEETPAPAPAPEPAPTPPSSAIPASPWTRTVDGTDTKRAADQLVRYTPGYGSNTGTNGYGVEASVVGGRITAIRNGVGNMTIPAGGYVLSGHGTSRTWLRDVAAAGSTVTLTGQDVTITAAPAPPATPVPATAAGATDSGQGSVGPVRASAKRSRYVRAVLRDKPSALLQGIRDLTGHGHRGTMVGRSTVTRLPNGDVARSFNGRGQYLRFADSKAFEIDATGALTVEYWMRPDALQFADTEGSGYVYTMGKGRPGAHEWYTRMYSKKNSESRPNRISGYSFNPRGGLGAGSYFQDRVTARAWIHVALVINTKARSARYPLGYTKIYKNGVLRDIDSLQSYDIHPRSGNAPLRIGTGYLSSYFKGAIGDVAFYNREVRAPRLAAHHAAGRKRA